jgi:hypothetical protein
MTSINLLGEWCEEALAGIWFVDSAQRETPPLRLGLHRLRLEEARGTTRVRAELLLISIVS